MVGANENYLLLIDLLKNIYSELQSQSELLNKTVLNSEKEFVFLPFSVSEIYVLEKSFVDAGGSPDENYKSLLEKTVPYLANKNQKGAVHRALPSIVTRWIPRQRIRSSVF